MIVAMLNALVGAPVLMEGETAGTISGLLADGTTVSTWIVTQMGTFLNFITSNPLIYLPIVVAVVGLGVNFLVRFLKAV